MIVSDELTGLPGAQVRRVYVVTDERDRDPLIALAVGVIRESEWDGATDIYFYASAEGIRDHAYHVLVEQKHSGGLRIVSRDANQTAALMRAVRER